MKLISIITLFALLACVFIADSGAQAQAVNWFEKLPNSVQQCIYNAGAKDPAVLNQITACRKEKGGKKCLEGIPQVAGCFP